MTKPPALLAVAVAIGGPAVGQTCEGETATVQSSDIETTFRVEIADDQQMRATGLAEYEDLGPQDGMLFLYDQPRTAIFWMLGMSFPLDLVFIREDGIVSSVKRDRQAGSLWPVWDSNILGVLEINAGAADANGIEAGSTVIHPAFTSCQRE